MFTSRIASSKLRLKLLMTLIGLMPAGNCVAQDSEAWAVIDGYDYVTDSDQSVTDSANVSLSSIDGYVDASVTDGHTHEHFHDSITNYGYAFTNTNHDNVRFIPHPAWDGQTPSWEYLETIGVDASWAESGEHSHVYYNQSMWSFYWVDSPTAPVPAQPFCTIQQSYTGQVTVDRPGVDKDETYMIDTQDGSFYETVGLSDAGITAYDEGYVRIGYSTTMEVRTEAPYDPYNPPVPADDAAFIYDWDWLEGYVVVETD